MRILISTLVAAASWIAAIAGAVSGAWVTIPFVLIGISSTLEAGREVDRLVRVRETRRWSRRVRGL